MAVRGFLLALAMVCCTGLLRAQSFSAQEVVIHMVDMEEGQMATDTMQLAGTLTRPLGVASKVPAVILITGSGAQNRDEELMGHRPFKVIAEYLSSNGFAVLRCDDRGVGGSTGDMVHATTLDFAGDVQRQLDYLQQRQELGIDPDRIFLFGHSEGANVAAIVAADNSHATHPVAGVAMLGGAATDGMEILLQQNEAIFRLKGVPDSLVERRMACMRDLYASLDTIFLGADADTVKTLNKAFRPIFKHHSAGLTKEQKQQCGLTNVDCYGWAVTVASPWMTTFLRLNPAEYIAQLKCPLLAIGGEQDCQVLPVNLDQIERICAEHQVPCTIRSLAGVNHLGQKCQTGAADEYAKLGQAPDEEVLAALKQWLEGVSGSSPASKF